ncbi:MAG: hypothetical protein OQK05_14160, partial [Pseudopelagicola sp.]|nr:hypothetical protein [Pseudopelagicola sp.]
CVAGDRLDHRQQNHLGLCDLRKPRPFAQRKTPPSRNGTCRVIEITSVRLATNSKLMKDENDAGRPGQDRVPGANQ